MANPSGQCPFLIPVMEEVYRVIGRALGNR